MRHILLTDANYLKILENFSEELPKYNCSLEELLRDDSFLNKNFIEIYGIAEREDLFVDLDSALDIKMQLDRNKHKASADEIIKSLLKKIETLEADIEYVELIEETCDDCDLV